MAKPLISPLLLENSNTTQETPGQALQGLTIGPIVDYSTAVSPVIWFTLRKLTKLKA